jgi:hypothetical protein
MLFEEKDSGNEQKNIITILCINISNENHFKWKLMGVSNDYN